MLNLKPGFSIYSLLSTVSYLIQFFHLKFDYALSSNVFISGPETRSFDKFAWQPKIL
jgi:hypothetical protein